MFSEAKTLGVSIKQIRWYIGQNYLVSTEKGEFFLVASEKTLLNIKTRANFEAKILEAHN